MKLSTESTHPLGRHKKMLRSFSLVRVCLALVSLAVGQLALDAAVAQDDSDSTNPSSASPEQLRFFENHIRPLLIDKCLECHGEQKQEAGLRLDHRQGLLEGGDSGPVVDLESGGASILLEAIRYESVEMPPDEMLSEESILHFEQWISEGLPWPSDDVLQRARDGAAAFTDEDRSHWSFQRLEPVAIPRVDDDQWCRSDIDRYILFKLEQAGLRPANEADKRTLLRRVSFDITGLPPTPEMIREFLADDRPDAYERLVKQLLESPQYGERWAQLWLDLVRYADSDGYKADFVRPDAWRYRDYVIHSLNADKPYDRFVMEQIAGDEIAPGDPQALIATGFLRHWIYEYNQRDTVSQWQIILDDITETTADTFLGLGFSCARCHDHKYDPILQSDYFRMQAFFNSIYARDDLFAVDDATRNEYEQQLDRWKEATAEIRTQIDQVEAQTLKNAEHRAVEKFPADIQSLYYAGRDGLTTYEKQIWHLVYLQVLDEQNKVKFDTKLKDEPLETWKRLQEELAEFDELKPKPLPKAFGVTDWDSTPAETRIPGDSSEELIEPGFMVLFGEDMPLIEPVEQEQSTGRRTVLARWIASAENPLTARVMVNRVWQQYFGQGIVGTASDFGMLGDQPSHPELLDHLAVRFIDSGWSLKQLHYDIVTSAAYRQASWSEEAEHASAVDSANRLIWKMNRRRLDAEQLRDALLMVTGELNLRPGGPGVNDDAKRRTIYGKVLRNRRQPFLEAFDFPDRIKSIGQRSETTTPNQALAMMNGAWVQQRASMLATQSNAAEEFDLPRSLSLAMERSVARFPTTEEIAFAQSFLDEQARLAAEDVDNPQEALKVAWQDLCNVLLNTNEFLYLD